jgi:hypothetical protein
MFCTASFAKTTVPEKQKIVFVKFTDVQDIAPVTVIDLNINYFVVDNLFTVLQTNKSKIKPFFVLPNSCWSSNLFVRHYERYKSKFNKNNIPDHRKNLQKLGVTFTQLLC